ncbi:hypothetical protein [Microbacterium sp. 18062]|uniref:hypothetical protein n=1 Tax=Microbacterium sp. 18062 TaxID=2681410 RepID=UPI00135B2E2E|nr:hypothetical protein [Microbacterium sp. 18062]
MHWATEHAASDVWAFELEAARRNLAAALAAIERVCGASRDLVAATAWSSPAMAAFQGQQDAWLADLERRRYDLDELDRVLIDTRSYLLTQEWVLAR